MQIKVMKMKRFNFLLKGFLMSSDSEAVVEDCMMYALHKMFGYDLHLEECGVEEDGKKENDVPEIIRCKDCKHWYPDADTGMACEFTNMSQPDDGFCNWAERREDE